MDREKVDLAFKNSLLKTSRTINTMSGLWPYMPRGNKIIKQIICMIVLCLDIVPEVSAVTVQCGKDWPLCAENIAGSVYTIGIVTKYVIPIISRKKFESLYQNVVENWESITDPEEQKIMTDVANSGNLMSLFYIVFVLGGGMFYGQVPMIPPIMDYLMPLNESRKKIILANAEYPFDPYQYYYELHVFYSILVVINLTTILSTDTTFIGIVHQSLSLFKITKHRIEKAADIRDEKKVHQQILSAIKMHQLALEFFDTIESIYRIVYLLFIGMTIIFISFGAVTVIERTDNIADFLRAVFLESAATTHLFFISWQGQLMIDQTEDLFITTYINGWYDMPKKTKSLIHIMMDRCIKPCILTAGGLYIMDFQNFGMIIKTTLSYITVCLNAQ